MLPESPDNLPPRAVIKTPAGFTYTMCPPASAKLTLRDMVKIKIHPMSGLRVDISRELTKKRKESRPRVTKRDKLNPAKASKIRKLHQSGVKQREIAKEFGVTAATVCKVVHKSIWINL